MPAEHFPCIHRGDVVRTERCKSCKGDIDAPVKACALKGECTIFVHRLTRPGTEEPLPVCAMCPARQAPIGAEIAPLSSAPVPLAVTGPRPPATKRLTIGMAVHMTQQHEFDAVWFTIEALMMYHAAALEGGEIIVVDNNPSSVPSKRLKALIGYWLAGQVRYFEFTKTTGTAAPRNHIFQVAEGKIVCVIDPHILIPLRAFDSLLEYAAQNPDSKDLWQGPMLHDHQRVDDVSTHMAPGWSDQMYGTWDVDARGKDPAGEPFEIPLHGLGLFACFRDAWLGFHPRMRGFGAEEGYIHEKFRKAGRKALCLPFLRWLHRFNEPGTAGYPLSANDKFRNYLLGWSELGLGTAEARAHFQRWIPEDQIKAAYADVGVPDPGPQTPGSAPALQAKSSWTNSPTPVISLLDIEFERICNSPGPINAHLGTLQQLAQSLEHVTEIGAGHGLSSVALLAARPRNLHSYDPNPRIDTKALSNIAAATRWQIRKGDALEVPPIEPTDLLFINSRKSFAGLTAELERHAGNVRSYLVVAGTADYGQVGDDGQTPGMMQALAEFAKSHNWRLARMDRHSGGLIVLERTAQPAELEITTPPMTTTPEPSPEPVLLPIAGAPVKIKRSPSIWAKALHIGQAVVAHIADGLVNVSRKNYQDRLEECETCELLQDNGTCGVCGCPIALKAKMRSEFCPHAGGNRWKEADELHQVKEAA